LEEVCGYWQVPERQPVAYEVQLLPWPELQQSVSVAQA
jgi:hypothetical protein